jgi:hypothetical protein
VDGQFGAAHIAHQSAWAKNRGEPVDPTHDRQHRYRQHNQIRRNASLDRAIPVGNGTVDRSQAHGLGGLGGVCVHASDLAGKPGGSQGKSDGGSNQPGSNDDNPLEHLSVLLFSQRSSHIGWASKVRKNPRMPIIDLCGALPGAQDSASVVRDAARHQCERRTSHLSSQKRE